MKRLLAALFLVLILFVAVWQLGSFVLAQEQTDSLLKPSLESFSSQGGTRDLYLKELLNSQQIGSIWANPIKYALRNAVNVGVASSTIVLLLLLPVVATIIAGARHFIGLRGFGIFLPAALSVVFVATGPIVGIGLFLIIVFVSTLVRVLLKKLKLRLQYLPRMAFILLAVVVGVFLTILAVPQAYVWRSIAEVSIFPLLILVLLAEDFTRAQIGKSVKTAISLTSETLILALVSFGFLTLRELQRYAILHPEAILLGLGVVNIIMGRYVGLRVIEFWRFRKLIRS